MPVLSARTLCGTGHEVLYRKLGCAIIDTKTGQTTKFIQRAGVYYLKLRVLRPASRERAAGSRAVEVLLTLAGENPQLFRPFRVSGPAA